MARSIQDWYNNRADQSMADRFDDESVERPVPWDRRGRTNFGRSGKRSQKQRTSESIPPTKAKTTSEPAKPSEAMR